MAKYLIWDLNQKLVNTGGPSGYLFNIHEYLKSEKREPDILFISDLLGIDNTQGAEAMESLKSSFQKSRFYDLYKKVAKYRYFSIDACDLIFKNDKLPHQLDLNEFDAIHFHSSIDLNKAKKLLSGYKGKIILTSHSPQPHSNELLERVQLPGWISRPIANLLYKAELNAWNRADFIMFPVPDATEPYKKSPEFNQYLTQNTHKLIYCPSSILPNLSFHDVPIREKLNIPEKAFIICYMGRHNHVKGYDELKKFGERILKKYDNVYFLVAGRETPLTGLEHPRWIELGWINYGNDILRESNLFVLPNAETYFDLVTLEVLRVGTPILMSRTGGNKYFEEDAAKQGSGLKLYDYGNLDDQEEKFVYFYNEIRRGKGNSMIDNNRNLFNSRFTVREFINRYRDMLRSLPIPNN